MTPLAAPTCPLCGGPNACRPAQTGSFDGPCWCQSTAIEPALLARVPPALRGTACICARCAGAATAAPPGIADAA
ncbi:MAG: cysteine-rich CWC family protein [Caldimonas sp.]